jgi:16S rRNA (uracil1498-N3)-methyltransferase
VHRFYVVAFPHSGEFDLPADEARHLFRVLRLRPGDTIAVFDGDGREVLARVESAGSQHVRVRAIEPRAPAAEARVRVTLAQALLKGDKMDRVISDAVMLGVAAIQPCVTRRTDVPMRALREGGRQDRWQRTVVSSVKQCGRAVVPRIQETKPFTELLRSGLPEPRLMFVEPAAGVHAAEVASLEQQRPAEATVIIGPEGGWDPRDIDEARSAGVTLLSFGERVLRADAAAAAVLSVLRYIWRDL